MYDINNILSYLIQERVRFLIICIILFVVFFIYFWKIIDGFSSFSKSTSFILSLGLAIISTLAGLIKIIANFFSKLFILFWNLGLIYTILFLAGLLLALIIFGYIISLVLYPLIKKREKLKDARIKAGKKLFEKAGKLLEKGNIFR